LMIVMIVSGVMGNEVWGKEIWGTEFRLLFLAAMSLFILLAFVVELPYKDRQHTEEVHSIGAPPQLVADHFPRDQLIDLWLFLLISRQQAPGLRLLLSVRLRRR